MAHVYNTGDDDIDFESSTMKLRLVTTGYTFARTHATMASTTAYALGTDQTLTGKLSTVDQTNHFAYWHADTPVTFTAVAGTTAIGGVVLYKFVTNDADSIPVAFYDNEATAPAGRNVIVNLPSDAGGGLLRRKQESL